MDLTRIYENVSTITPAQLDASEDMISLPDGRYLCEIHRGLAGKDKYIYGYEVGFPDGRAVRMRDCVAAYEHLLRKDFLVPTNKGYSAQYRIFPPFMGVEDKDKWEVVTRFRGMWEVSVLDDEEVYARELYYDRLRPDTFHVLVEKKRYEDRSHLYLRQT